MAWAYWQSEQQNTGRPLGPESIGLNRVDLTTGFHQHIEPVRACIGGDRGPRASFQGRAGASGTVVALVSVIDAISDSA